MVGDKRFSRTHTILIRAAWVLVVAWMIWLAVTAWRMPDSVVARLMTQSAGNITRLKISHR